MKARELILGKPLVYYVHSKIKENFYQIVKANEQKKKANISYNSEICSIGENRGNFVKREPQIQSNFHSDV